MCLYCGYSCCIAHNIFELELELAGFLEELDQVAENQQTVAAAAVVVAFAETDQLVAERVVAEPFVVERNHLLDLELQMLVA